MEKYWLITYCCAPLDGRGNLMYVTTVTNWHPAVYLQDCIDQERKAERSYWKQFGLVFAMEIDEATFHEYDGRLSS